MPRSWTSASPRSIPAGEAVDRAETVSALSHRGAIVGTPAYMSPEQARGEPLDPRSDLFSVGVLLYEMVSGQRPFQGTSSAAIAAAMLTHEPSPLARFAPNTPAELERIVTKLLKKRPDSRYQTAKDLLIDLRTLKEEQEFQLRLGRTPRPPERTVHGRIVGDQRDPRRIASRRPEHAAGAADAGRSRPPDSCSWVVRCSSGRRRVVRLAEQPMCDGRRRRSRKWRRWPKPSATPRRTISPWRSSRTCRATRRSRV